jgi:hypothetical protein
VQQINVPDGTTPFVSWLQTDSNGFFADSATMNAGASIQLRFSAMDMNQTLYSDPVSFVVPFAGDNYSFGTITLRNGGMITGRLKDSDGNFLNGGSIFWNHVGGSGAGEVYFNAPIDSLGNFTISGPPSTTLTNMIAGVQSGPGNYSIPARTLVFPASGQTSNIGTIIVTSGGLSK